MMANVKPIPEGYHSVTPYLIVKQAAEAIGFYERAFRAQELMRLEMPGGVIGHAEIRIGDSIVMMAEENPAMGALAPETVGGSPVNLLFYVEDVDAVFAQALSAGAIEVRPVLDQFYGDRAGTLKDPYGHTWSIASHIEDVSLEEVKRRMDALMSSGGGA